MWDNRFTGRREIWFCAPQRLVRKVPQVINCDWLEAGVAVSKPQEKRGEQRVRLEVTASVTAGHHTIAASTKDVSSRGLFFFTDARLELGREVDVITVLPEDVGLPLSGLVCCHGCVVRSRPTGGQYGVAVHFDRFTPVRQI